MYFNSLPIYWYTLRFVYHKTKTKFLAFKSLNSVLKNTLPILVVDEIFKYLEIEDLHLLVQNHKVQ